MRAGELSVSESILADHPELAEDAEKAIDVIYTEYVTREELGQNPAGKELCQRFPQWSSRLERLLDIDAALGDVKPEALTIQPKSTWNGKYQEVTTHANSPGSAIRRRLGQYEILQEIGRGGMGIVYRARQLMLHRIVALKVVQAAQISPGQQARFRTEAMAIGQLQHPNIIRVIEIGEHDDCHFISLEYAAEGSLDRKLQAGVFGIRAAAETVETLALAVEHAHQMGIVHRDLKPANVLIAAGGVLKVADFGLAKWYLSPATNDQTQSGALLGTPCYMAPEQAGGRIDQVGPSTDIYALGTILYELLIGRPPFISESALQTLEQIRLEEPPALRRSRKSVPRDLETICLRCLQKDPRRRFPSARELAEDLRRFLDHEPIQSRNVSLYEKAGRWIRRYAVVNGLAATMLLMFLIGTIGLILGRRQIDDLSHNYAKSSQRVKVSELEAAAAKSDAAAAKSDAAAAKSDAQESMKQAKAMIDRLMKQGEDLMRRPGLSDIGQKSLDEVLTYYDGLLQRMPQDIQLLSNAADAFVLSGQFHRDRGDYEPAEKQIRRGIALWNDVLKQDPDNTRGQYGLAKAKGQIATLERSVNRVDESEVSYREAVALLEKLVARHPKIRGYRQRLGNMLLNLAVPMNIRGRLAASDQVLRHGVEVIWEGVDQSITAFGGEKFEKRDVWLASVLAATRDLTRGNSRQLPDAMILRQLPNKVLTQVLNEHWATHLALGYEDLSLIWERQGFIPEAERGFRQAFEIRRMALMYGGQTSEHVELLARSHWTLARCEFRHGNILDAEQHLRESIDLLVNLEKDYPRWTSYSNSIAVSQILLGKSLRIRGMYDESQEALESAVQRYERIRGTAKSFYLRFGLSEARRELGLTLHDQGRFNDAIVMLRESFQGEPFNMLALYDLGYCLSIVPDLQFRRTMGTFSIPIKSLESAARMRRDLLLAGKLTKSPEFGRSRKRSLQVTNAERMLQSVIAWYLHRPVRSLQLVGRVARSLRTPPVSPPLPTTAPRPRQSGTKPLPRPAAQPNGAAK